jgi:cbb3-type cytochrome oxidase maturation protein
MTILIVLIILSLTLASGFLCAFVWAIRAHQFDDTYGPSVRMLMEEDVTFSKEE